MRSKILNQIMIPCLRSVSTVLSLFETWTETLSMPDSIRDHHPTIAATCVVRPAQFSCKGARKTARCTVYSDDSVQDVDHKLKIKTIAGNLKNLCLRQCSPLCPGEAGLLQKIMSLIATSTSLRALSLSDQHQDLNLPRSAPSPNRFNL